MGIRGLPEKKNQCLKGNSFKLEDVKQVLIKSLWFKITVLQQYVLCYFDMGFGLC